MRPKSRSTRRLPWTAFALPAAMTLNLIACGGDPGGYDGAVRVDTLVGGGIHVRNPEIGAWERNGVPPWRLEVDLRIGRVDGTGPDVFGSVRNVIPDALGRLWVMDSQARELRVFEDDGTFVRAVGREGEGPGEFSGNTCAFAGPDGEIWVEDSRRRWQRFDTTGTLLGGRPSTSNLGCGIRRWTPDGRLAAAGSLMDPETRTSTSYYLIHARDHEGELLEPDTIFPPEVPERPSVTWISADDRFRIVSTIPFAAAPFRQMGPQGDFWVAEGGGPYRIRRQTLEGDTVLVVEREYEPVPVPDSLRDQEIEDFVRDDMSPEDGFDAADVPGVFPPFDRPIPATDGSLWVQRRMGDGAAALDVFSSEGVYLGAAELPPDFGNMFVRFVTRDHMYVRLTDELDVNYVVRLAILRPER